MTNNSSKTELAILSWIQSTSKGILEKETDSSFVKYLITENSEISINNISWYIKSICKNIPLFGKLLDLGCGFGLHSILLKENESNIQETIGIDPNKIKIKVFQTILKKFKIKNCQARIGYGENLPFANNIFDFVYGNECLSHVRDIQQVLRQIYRVLKKGGRIIVSDTEKLNPYSLWFVYLKGHRDENYFHQQTVKKLLIHCGFVNIQRVKGIVAPRNPLREKANMLWPIMRFIDPKYVLVGEKK